MTAPTILRMKNIVKAFGTNTVLRGVDFELQQGEVHALLGSNGAGKSTLMKILEGVYTPDGGEIEINGTPVRIRSTQEANALGIGMVFQEFSLIPTLTVAQNVFLTREPRTSLRLLDDAESVRRTQTLFAEMGEQIDPRQVVARMSTGYWQLTEIAKALAQNARILILDEPTASLTRSETEGLFELIRRLKARGISIIYISHRMEEIFEIADRITVMRDGERVITESIANLTMEQVIEYIVGQKIEQALAWKPRQINRAATPLLEVEHLVAANKIRDISFTLHPGEILGLAGLMGSGRTELVQALFGINKITRGEVRVRGRWVTIRNPDDAIAAGISLIPEDRRVQGLVLDHSVKDNLLLPLLKHFLRFGLIDDAAGNRLVRSYVNDLHIKVASIFQPIRRLSGGNQQKVVIAKWLAAEPEILLMDEPTAGVDIGSKVEIITIIRQLADSGKGVIVISSEFPELLAVSDRIIVLQDGTVKRQLDRHEIESEQELHEIVQAAGEHIYSVGPHGEPATPAGQVQLTPQELQKIQDMHATAAIVLHYSGNDWSDAQVDGLKQQFATMGIKVIAVTDANFNANTQVSDIETVLAKKPNIIVSIPVDPVATANAYRKAVNQGVKLVFMDNVPQGFTAGTDYISVVSADNYGNGATAALLMAEKLDGKGKIGLIYHDADFFVTKQRYEAFKATIAKFPDIQIVSEKGIAGPGFAGAAETAASTMLTQYPDLNGIWVVWDVPAEGVLAAARTANRSDLVITTCDLGLNAAIAIARGQIYGLGAQRPFDQGATEATLAGYGLLGKAAPAYVVHSALAVSRASLLQAWQTVYHQEPPPVLVEAIQPSPVAK
jgi:ribose transport system ATP-binding protein